MVMIDTKSHTIQRKQITIEKLQVIRDTLRLFVFYGCFLNRDYTTTAKIF